MSRFIVIFVTMDLIYNIYGSKDSQDIDACIFLEELPSSIEERKDLTNVIKKTCFGDDWNLILATVKDGIITDCTYPKSSPDSLNNAIFMTYDLHFEHQKHPMQVKRSVERCKVLAIYKTVRQILSYLSRTDYRSYLRPEMNWKFPFEEKIQKLSTIDFTSIKDFNQKNVPNLDVWKTLAFYIVQNDALLEDVHVHTKDAACSWNPKMKEAIHRHAFRKIVFQETFENYIEKISKLKFLQHENVLTLGEEICDMINELPIYHI